ncbi:MAG: hypothetical protein ABSE73_01025 [Planctomycetota bacterium]
MELAQPNGVSVISAPAKPRWRLQFSLRTLVLLTITAGALLLFGMSYRETLALREETKRLRDALGVLTITDSKKVHVVAGRTDEDKVWRWRVFCPVKSQLRVYYKFDQIVDSPAKGKETKNGCESSERNGHLPSQNDAEQRDGAFDGSSSLHEGETTLIAALEESRVGNWQLHLSLNGSSFGGAIPIAMQEMFDGGNYALGCDFLEGVRGTIAFDPGKVHNLLHMRWWHESHAFFLKVWIDEENQNGHRQPKTAAGGAEP